MNAIVHGIRFVRGEAIPSVITIPVIDGNGLEAARGEAMQKARLFQVRWPRVIGWSGIAGEYTANDCALFALEQERLIER